MQYEKIVYYKIYGKKMDGEFIHENICGVCGSVGSIKTVHKSIFDINQLV